jgi:hypothetical protein
LKLISKHVPPPPPPPAPEPTYTVELTRSELATIGAGLFASTQEQRKDAAQHSSLLEPILDVADKSDLLDGLLELLK